MADPPESGIKLTSKIDFDNAAVWIGATWDDNRVKVGVPLGARLPDTTPLIIPGQNIVRGVTQFQDDAEATINNSKSNNYRLTLGTRNDILIAQAIVRGVEQLTLEVLDNGHFLPCLRDIEESTRGQEAPRLAWPPLDAGCCRPFGSTWAQGFERGS